MPLPILPIVAGKVAFAAGAALFAHRMTRRLQRVSDYADLTPPFLPTRHLHGVWKGEGVLHGPMGGVKTRLSGWMEGTWLDQHGELRIGLRDDQGTFWSDTLRFQPPAGSGPDGQAWELSQNGAPIGQAACAGNTLHLSRAAVLPPHLGAWKVGMEDWFHLLADDRCMQRATWSKLATPLLDLAITWTRQMPGN